MTIITSEMLADMHARRLSGESNASIASRYRLKPITVYQRLRRELGLRQSRAANVAAANDNNPNVTTQMTPHNGGCSTWSGVVPVSVKRIPTLDVAEVALSASELRLDELQVAA
ncbi:hypothetical protein A4U53_031065 [Rhizobium ruizarguesonis]|uniref:Uncharacterized protein n=2 Tax=Rhizobium TaxID=379 RepID=A0A179BVL1_RHILE|nr:hypothetical protein [Rhizobium leguminosarum]OAP95144.1 hypothetical protein A4U53_18150 [Rhizobium leguminosarum]